jgi:hypothetical protein
VKCIAFKEEEYPDDGGIKVLVVIYKLPVGISWTLFDMVVRECKGKFKDGQLINLNDLGVEVQKKGIMKKYWICGQGYFASPLEEKQCRNFHMVNLECFSFSPDYGGDTGFFLILNL